MRIDRRELLRQFGGAAGAAALLPSVLKPADSSVDSAARLVRLDRNESAHGPCEKAKVAFRDAVIEANRYPDTEVKNLCAAVAALHHVQAENITLGCGSTELLCIAAQTYLGPGRSLITASPTHEAIALAARLVGAEVRSLPLTRLYGHDLGAMLAKSDNTTGLVYICNPNNPTGTLTPKADLEAWLAKLPPGISVLIDEAYHDYVAPSDGYASWAARAAANPRLIVTRTFSKAYGLAGLRAGYAVSSIETAKQLAARRLPMDVNAVAARVALAALSDPEYVKKIALLNADDRQEFYNQANARMLRSLDSQTNFVLLATGRPGTEVAELLRSHQVLVTSGYPHFENYIRVSLGLPQDMKSFWRAWDASMPHHPM
jgi:histidinol-phosphate aminotransferase